MDEQAEGAPDEALAMEAQHGDMHALSTLLKRYEPRLVRYARSLLHSATDADDVLQEAFIKVYGNLRGYDPKRRFSPWIYRIVHNEAISFIRKEKRFRWLDIEADTILPHLKSDEPSPEDEVVNAQMQEHVRNCLEKLDVKYREVLQLRYLDEFSYEEIADILEVPLSTVGVRIKRGKEQLSRVCDQPQP